jgi:hypothetical protein
MDASQSSGEFASELAGGLGFASELAGGLGFASELAGGLYQRRTISPPA